MNEIDYDAMFDQAISKLTSLHNDYKNGYVMNNEENVLMWLRHMDILAQEIVYIRNHIGIKYYHKNM